MLYAEGIDADYIDTGAIRITDTAGNELLYASYDTKQVRINASSVFIGTKTITDNLVEMAAAISVAQDSINLKVSKGDISSQLSVESGAVSIKSNRFSWESTNSSLSSDGKLTAKNVDLSGKITASSGKIEDLSIESYSIYTGAGVFELDGIYIGSKGFSVMNSAATAGLSVEVSSGNVNIYGYDSEITLGPKNSSNADVKITRSKVSIKNLDLYDDSTGSNVYTSNSRLNIKSGLSIYMIVGSTTSPTIEVNLSGVTIGKSSGKVGFFGDAGASKQSISTIASTTTATASTVASKVNEVINALKAYNLIS